MKNNFWFKINQPILALAPMAGFNNLVFRQIAQDYGADLVYSEMASATALYYNLGQANKTLELLKRAQSEKNYIVQLFGADDKHFALATKVINKKIKPDGIDINCGCPVTKVVKQGAGIDLMRQPKRARRIIKAVLANTDLPVSIKIRAGVGKITALDFVNQLSDLPLAAIMIHGRSLAQGFSGPIDCSLIAKLKKIFKGKLLANGGINDLETARDVLHKTQSDGLALGRAALARPYLFSEIKQNKKINFTKSDLFALIERHSRLVEKEFGPSGLVTLRKHLCYYVQGIPGAKSLREKLTQVKSLSDIREALKL